MTTIQSAFTRIVSVFSVLGFCFLGLLSCSDKADDNILDQALDTGEPLLFINFDKEFAQRFSLPTTEATNLSEHLHGMVVEINRINSHYACTLHLYVDDQLTLYVPATDNYFTSRPLAESFFVREYGPRDQAWNSEKIAGNLMHILFRSQSLDNSNKGLASTLQYSRVHKTFLPGLSIYSLDTECLLFEKQNFPADIWVQKGDYEGRPIGEEDPRKASFKENAYQFSIPESLMDVIQPYISIAAEKNSR